LLLCLILRGSFFIFCSSCLLFSIICQINFWILIIYLGLLCNILLDFFFLLCLFKWCFFLGNIFTGFFCIRFIFSCINNQFLLNFLCCIVQHKNLSYIDLFMFWYCYNNFPRLIITFLLDYRYCKSCKTLN